MNLKGEILNIKKGTDSVDLYLEKINVVKDKLMAVCILVDDEELLHIALWGLSKDFNSFRSTIHTRSAELTFDELTTLLNVEEEFLTEFVEIKDAFALTVLEFFVIQLSYLLNMVVLRGN